MGDWLINSGIVGLCNILKHSGDQVEVTSQQLEFDVEALENFEEKYFKYLIDKYEKTLSWYKIVSYEKILQYHEDNDFDTFKDDDLDKLNKYIKDVLKYYLNSASYKAAYGVMDNQLDVIKLTKELETIKLKKSEKIEDKLQDIKDAFKKVQVLIDYCKEADSRKYLAAKNVIYTIVKNAWEGICFLNPQTKEKDMYLDYKGYFIEPVKDYVEEDKKKYKYDCFTCNGKMKDMKNDLSFLNNMGFDVSRKSSHVWNFNNDIAVCPICKLVYSCIPAGFTYVYDRGVYINESTRLETAININNNVKTQILNETDINANLTYRGLVYAINEQSNEKMKYELADIQVVKLEDGKYRFNILSRQMLNIINTSKDDLNRIIKGGFTEGKDYFNIYELVIERILNNQNLFLLIHKLLVVKITSQDTKKVRFGTGQVVRIMNINKRIMEGMGYMEKANKDIVGLAKNSGYYLREDYKNKKAKDKLNGIAYRLLNALKTSNKNMFMDTLLNCYLYVQKTVPNIFMEALRDDEKFKTIGYAFVAGLIEGKDNENDKDKKNGGNE
nr:type I-B CRISPR-associated protein Cas8b1/Cst1 [Alkaliphilus hydrothermalis]